MKLRCLVHNIEVEVTEKERKFSDLKISEIPDCVLFVEEKPGEYQSGCKIVQEE